MKKVVVIGKSEKFLQLIRSIHNNSQLTAMSWRNLKKYKTLLNEDELEIIYLTGFDYESLKYSYVEYFNQNITIPLKFLSNIFGSKVKIVYINTKIENRKYTFSRYYFSKFTLGTQLDMMHKNFKNVPIGTVIDENKTPLIYGSKFTKALFMIMIKLKLIETTSLEEVMKKILCENSKFSHNRALNLIFPNLPRSIFLDRFLRFLVG